MTILRFLVTGGIINHMKKLLLALSITIGVTSAGYAFAADGATCDLSAQYKDFLSATQAPSYSQEAVQRELGARIKLLSATIGCAEKDLQTLKASLPDPANGKVGQVRDRVIGAIDDADRFYELKKSTLAGQGIQGTKDLAQDIKNWREANYNNLLGRVQNFLVWNDNQKFFDTASDRLSQSQFVVTSLKIIDDQNAQNLLSAARDNLSGANDLNNRAGDAIARGATPDETMDIIKQSLSSLAVAYKSFLGIGNQLSGTVVATSTNE